MSINRKLASIQQIRSIEPAENADSLEVAIINNWRCVVQKGINSVGEKVLFFETDAFLPQITLFEFLRKSCYKEMEDENGNLIGGFRLRTIKLRGNVSQGLVMPLDLDTVNYFYRLTYYSFDQMEIGTAVTDILNVKLFEPPIPEDLKGKVSGWPGNVPKTGAERLQNLNFNDIKDIVFYVTEKIDGVSTTFWKYNNEFHAATRNWSINNNADKSTYVWRLANMYNLINTLPNNYVVQGEAIGPGTGSMKYATHKPKSDIDGLKFYVFNVYDIEHARYLSLLEMQDFCHKYSLDIVPISQSKFVFQTPDDIEFIFKAADNTKSELNSNVKIEGFVLHPVNHNQMYLFDRIKVISKQYELKGE